MAIAFLIFLWSWLACPDALAAPASSALLKARQEAETKGYVFITNRDEILKKARTEGKLRVLSGLVLSTPALVETFKKKYPFIDLDVEIHKSLTEHQRFIAELQVGRSKDWDVARTVTDFYSAYLPYLWKVDLLGMAEHGVLGIHPQMIDPKNRNVVAVTSRFAVVPYNKNLVSQDQVPKSWEDMLKPEWKGRRFAVEHHPKEASWLVPAWGLEKTMDYARKIAAQQPMFVQGGTRTLVAVAAGEVPLFLFGANHGNTTRAQSKDPLGVMQYAVFEPAPVAIGNEHGILSMSKNPHAALLWLEFIAGPEAQKLIDQREPLVASHYSKGSFTEQALRGKKLSLVSWDDNEKMERWVPKLVEAYGFPRAEKN